MNDSESPISIYLTHQFKIEFMIPFQFRFLFKTKYFINFQAFGVFFNKRIHIMSLF